MPVESKEDLGRLYELVGALNPEEIALLRSFPSKDEVSPLSLASKSYVLPKLVRASLRRLAELGLVEIARIEVKRQSEDTALDAERARLTLQGYEAQTIARLVGSKALRA